MTDVRFLYITTKDFSEARVLAQKALEERVVACANIFTTVESMYWWQGSIQNSSECVLLLKTRADKVDEAMAVIKHWHSYSVPCIVTIPIEKGDEPYLNWLRGEVKA